MDRQVFDFSRTETEYMDRVVVSHQDQQFLLQLMHWPGSLELRFKIVGAGNYLKVYCGPERAIDLMQHFAGPSGILALGELCKRMDDVYQSPASTGWINSSVAQVTRKTLNRFSELLGVVAIRLANQEDGDS